MLFASLSESVGSLIAVIILTVGFMRMGKVLTGNKAVKGAARDGLLSVLGRIFKR